MAIISPYEGEVWLLQKMLSSTVYLRLFNIPTTFDRTITFSGLGETTGYTPASLTSGNWTISTTGGITSAVYNSSINLAVSIPQVVYGYFVSNTNAGGAYILWIELFSAPVSIPGGGGNIIFVPQIVLE